MRSLILFLITLSALVGCLAWLIIEPGFEPAITLSSLLIATITLFYAWFKDLSDEDMSAEPNQMIVLDGSTFLANSKSIRKVTYQENMKVWEFLELVNEFIPVANAKSYGRTWVLRNVDTGVTLQNLSIYARERSFLEEARSILHIGLKPSAVLKVDKV